MVENIQPGVVNSGIKIIQPGVTNPTKQTQNKNQNTTQQVGVTQEEAQAKSEEQKEKIKDKIEELRQKQVALGKSTKQNQPISYGYDAQINSLKSYLSNIESGGYYEDFDAVLNQSQSAATTARIAEASNISRANASFNLPDKNKKLVKTEYKDGQITRTYEEEIPANKQAVQNKQSNVQIGNYYQDTKGNVYGPDFVGPLPPDVSPISPTPETAEAIQKSKYSTVVAEKQQSSSNQNTGKTYASDFVGPLQPGDIREGETTTTSSQDLNNTLTKKEIRQFTKDESKRYQDYGYSKKDSKILAEESLKRGGKVLSEQEAESVLNPQKVTTEKENGKYNVSSGSNSSLPVGVEDRNSRSDFVSGFSDYRPKAEEQKQEIYEQAILTLPEKYNPIRFETGDALKSVGKRFINAITSKEIFTGETKISDIVDPLKYTGELKEDKIIFYEEQFGTTDEAFVGKTPNDILTEKIIENPDLLNYQNLNEEAAQYKLVEKVQQPIIEKYQTRIDTGELTLEEAKNQAELEYQQKISSKEFQEQSNNISNYFETQRKLGIGERTGADVAKAIPGILETGGLIALSLTGPAGATAVSAIITTEGSKKITEASLNKNLDVKERLLLGGAGVAEVALGVIGGGGVIKQTQRATEKALIQEELNALKRQPISFNSIQIQGEEGSLAILKAEQRLNNLKTEYDITARIVKEGDKRYLIPEGIAEGKTSGTFSSVDLYGKGKGTNIIAISEGKLGAKGINVENFDDVKIIFGNNQAIESEEVFKNIALKEVYEPQINSVVFFEKGTLEINRAIKFPSGKIIEKQSPQVEKFIKDFAGNIESGGKPKINLLRQNYNLRLQEEQRTLFNADYFSVTPDKKISGFTKVVEGDDFIKAIEQRNIYDIAKGNIDDLNKLALKRANIQNQKFTPDLINALDDVSKQQGNVLNKASEVEVKTNNVLELNIAAQTQDEIIQNVNVQANPQSDLKITELKREPQIQNVDVKIQEGFADLQDIKIDTRVKKEISIRELQKISERDVGIKKLLDIQQDAQIQDLALKLNQKQIQKNQSKQRQNQPQLITPEEIFGPNLNLRTAIKTDIPNIPNIPINRQKLPKIKKKQKKSKKTIPGYTASLEAALFQGAPIEITEEEYKKLVAGTYSGFEVRPVVAIKRRKDKRKKKEDKINFNIDFDVF